MSRLNQQRCEFSEHNLLLQVLLGVLSETDRIARLLPTPAPNIDHATETSIDAFGAALLGIVSFRTRLFDAVDDLTPSVSDGTGHTEARATTPATAAYSLRELIR